MSGFSGGCLCGQVRYQVSAAPLAARLCYCRVCQYLACGGPAANVMVPRTALTLRGALTAYRSVADSGNEMTRSFCGVCGTHVTSESSGRPGALVLRIGTLDEPGAVRPQMAIWTGSAPSWACLDPTLECFAQAAPAR